MDAEGTVQDCFELLINHGFKREQQLFAKIVECINFYLTPVEPCETHPALRDALQNTAHRGKLEDGEVEIDLKTEVVEQEGVKTGQTKIHKKDKNRKLTANVKSDTTTDDNNKKDDQNKTRTSDASFGVKVENYSARKRDKCFIPFTTSNANASSLKCDHCPFAVDSQNSKHFRSKLRRHKKAEHNICEICYKKQGNKDELKDHMRIVHMEGDGRLMCGIDGCKLRPKQIKGDSMIGVITHVKIVHERLKYICRECGKPYRKWAKHKLIHNSKTLSTCPECQLTFIAEASLKKHRRISHPSSQSEKVIKASTKLSCVACSFVTNGLSQDEPFKLLVHMKLHQGGEMICNLCPFKTRKRFTLQRHLTEQHMMGEIFQCTLCDYKTGGVSGRGHMKTHMSRHTKDQAFKCDQCDFVGYVRQSLERHMQRKHRETPKYLCDECDYKSSDFSNFNAHRQVKHGSVDLICDECGYNTKSSRSMREHKMKHSTCLLCSQCDFSTNSAKSLRAHEANNHN